MATSNATREAGEWVELTPVDEAGTLGCLLALAALLLLLGGGILAAFMAAPGGQGDAWVMPVVGGAFFLVGAFLLYGAIRGARGRSVAPPVLAIRPGPTLRPGSHATLRLRQPGPVRLESVTVTVSCRREYRRKVKPTSASTVPDHEVLWEQVLLEVSDEEVLQGGVLEREIAVALPADAAPTGPALPDGRVTWKIDVAVEAGFMRARHRAFDVRVEGAPAGVPGGAAGRASSGDWSGLFEPGDRREIPAGDTPPRAVPANRQGGRPAKQTSFGAGCLVIAVPFVLCGAFFLWAFFSGAAFHGRGNPYMALFGGLLFAGAGLFGIVVTLLTRGKKRRRR